jgi:hypothetical protein
MKAKVSEQKSEKMKRRGKVIRKGSYGTARTYSSSSSDAGDSYVGSDVQDLGGGGSVWNAERTPLLHRMQSEAR